MMNNEEIKMKLFLLRCEENGLHDQYGKTFVCFENIGQMTQLNYLKKHLNLEMGKTRTKIKTYELILKMRGNENV